MRSRERQWWARFENEAAACPACRSSRIRMLEGFSIPRTPERRRLAFISGCKTCGVLFVNPLPTARQLQQWKKTHRAAVDLTCSVNLSTGEIHRPNLVEDVDRVLRETGLPRGALKLEITESDIMQDPDKAAIVLQALRDVGAGLSLDDFGTGFSSLSYLTRLPFDLLKIDRYFVRTMGANEGSAKIVRSVINLGMDLQLEVVADGVENAGMANALLEIGCDYGQGFGYAPPLSAQEAEVYLNESYVDGAAPLKVRG